MSARRLLRLFHGWLGAFSAIFVILVGGSGALLAFQGQLFHAQYGSILEAPAPPRAKIADIDHMIEAVGKNIGRDFKPYGLFMPDTRIPGAETVLIYGMRASDPVGTYPLLVSVNPYTAKVQGSFRLNDAFGHQVIDFHSELVGGPLGATFVAVLGLLLTAFALTGLWLWWPRSKGLAHKLALPSVQQPRKRYWFALHGWTGVWVSLLILIFSLTGTATARPQWFGPLLQTSSVAPSALQQFTCGDTVAPGDAFKAASKLAPDRHLAMMEFGSTPGAPMSVHMRGPHDFDRMQGDVLVTVSATCRERATIILSDQSGVLHRLSSAMLSLHGGYSFGPIIGRLLVILTGIALAVLAMSGFYVFLSRTLASTKRSVTTERL